MFLYEINLEIRTTKSYRQNLFDNEILRYQFILISKKYK